MMEERELEFHKDGRQEGHIVCPKCGNDSFKVEWYDAGSGCAGGKLTLTCVSCKGSGVFYDDYA